MPPKRKRQVNGWKKATNKHTKYKGVHVQNVTNRSTKKSIISFSTFHTDDGKQTWNGYWDTPEKAAQAYDYLYLQERARKASIPHVAINPKNPHRCKTCNKGFRRPFLLRPHEQYCGLGIPTEMNFPSQPAVFPKQRQRYSSKLSLFCGVYLNKRSEVLGDRWMWRLRKIGSSNYGHSGTCDTEQQAAEAFDRKMIETSATRAQKFSLADELNFPEYVDSHLSKSIPEQLKIYNANALAAEKNKLNVLTVKQERNQLKQRQMLQERSVKKQKQNKITHVKVEKELENMSAFTAQHDKVKWELNLSGAGNTTSDADVVLMGQSLPQVSGSDSIAVLKVVTLEDRLEKGNKDAILVS